jgi:hypothetical protein
MSIKFCKVSAGRYVNAETGVEVIRPQSNDGRFGQQEWEVRVPLREPNQVGWNYDIAAIRATKAEAELAAVRHVEDMRQSIAQETPGSPSASGYDDER